MKEKRICPEWINTGSSLGSCRESAGALCQKSYASESFTICPLFRVTRTKEKKAKEAKIALAIEDKVACTLDPKIKGVVKNIGITEDPTGRKVFLYGVHLDKPIKHGERRILATMFFGWQLEKIEKGGTIEKEKIT